MLKKIAGLALLAVITAGCSKKGGPEPGKPDGPPVVTPVDNDKETLVTVDCSQSQGNIMRIEQANVHSTTSDLPGDKAKKWLQDLNHTLIRTWIQLRYVYNKGNINYNYKYSDSNVPLETSLAYYSQCTDSLLIALSAYTGTDASPMPARGIAFQNFVKETVLYYKRKYPKIKYIQVGNEPDYNEETVAQYYPVYQDYYRGINAANTELGLTGNNRIMISNGAFTSTQGFSNMLPYTNQFLAAYAADPDPAKKLDFFSFNCYTEQDNPKLFETAKQSINSAMQANGLPVIPVFVTEYGLVGGSFIPSVWTQADIMTAWPAAQLSKAFYLYQGGIDRVFNWSISHGTILHKSELGDLNNAFANPYGNALVLCRELSSRVTRIKATSTRLSDKGLGINALASMGNNKGIAVLVWNYNWTNSAADQDFNVEIKNIPQSGFNGKLNCKVYLIDSKTNNYYNVKSQTVLKADKEESYTYSSGLKVPLKLEKNAVALIVLTP